MSKVTAHLCIGLLLASLMSGLSAAEAEPVYLEQNWSSDDRAWFYYINQGSRLLNYQLFLHLPAATGEGLFRSDDNLRRYGFLVGEVNQYNPDGLPIGFARERLDLGLTCAACHTSEFEYQGTRIRIDGGQAAIDLQRFLLDLERALERLNKDPRLKQKLFSAVGWEAEQGQQILDAAQRQRQQENARNYTTLRYGPSRLDAFGAILNKGLALTGVEGNRNEPNGPTSYPYLWDTPHHDWVEWNGSSPNPKEGALARNVGEVLGVYGTVDVEPVKLLGLLDLGYRSSVRLKALRRIEKRVHQLHSPLWPEQHLPPIDRKLAAQGRLHYDNYCAECHLPIVRDAPDRRVQVRMSSIEAAGTDPAMAENVLQASGASGRFVGRKRFYVAGESLREQAPALHIVNHVMGGVVRNQGLQALFAFRDAKRMGQGEERHPPKYLDGVVMPRQSETSPRALAAYKARPLNGIWATAPYLHNGSVANLHELLLPASERSSEFSLGSWQFDPERVGYLSDGASDFSFDTRLAGNRNSGHEYGTGANGRPALTGAERRALLEYLKTL